MEKLPKKKPKKSVTFMVDPYVKEKLVMAIKEEMIKTKKRVTLSSKVEELLRMWLEENDKPA